MAKSNKKPKDDLDEFDALEPSASESGDEESMKITFDVPKGMDPKSLKAVMDSVKSVTAAQLQNDEAVAVGRKKYIEQSKVRYVCEVTSNRTPQWPDFELYISDPKTDRPIPVRGLCGQRIEDGLTKFVIDRLQQAHEWVSVEGWSMSAADIMQMSSVMVLTHKKAKKPLYSVIVYEEVSNPTPVGQKIKQKKLA